MVTSNFSINFEQKITIVSLYGEYNPKYDSLSKPVRYVYTFVQINTEHWCRSVDFSGYKTLTNYLKQ